MEMSELVPDYQLEYLDLHNLGQVHWNLSTPALYEYAVRSQHGTKAAYTNSIFTKWRTSDCAGNRQHI